MLVQKVNYQRLICISSLKLEPAHRLVSLKIPTGGNSSNAASLHSQPSASASARALRGKFARMLLLAVLSGTM